MKSTRRMVRKVVLRHGERFGKSKCGEYDATVDRLGAMAYKEEKIDGCNTKIEQFTGSPLRGFGLHKVVLGTGTYGHGVDACLRRQGRSGKDRLWSQKLKIPISNRIARASTSGRFGNYPVGGAEEVPVTLSDCFALGAPKCQNHTCGGGKLEPTNKEPRTLSRFILSAKQKIQPLGILYGTEHLEGRLGEMGQLRRFRAEKPELLAVSFLSTCWNRLFFGYAEIVRVGIMTLIQTLPE